MESLTILLIRSAVSSGFERPTNQVNLVKLFGEIDLICFALEILQKNVQIHIKKLRKMCSIYIENIRKMWYSFIINKKEVSSLETKRNFRTYPLEE